MTNLEPCLGITVICHKEQAYQKNNLAISKKCFVFFTKVSTVQKLHISFDFVVTQVGKMRTIDTKCLRCLRALQPQFPYQDLFSFFSFSQSLAIPNPEELLECLFVGQDVHGVQDENIGT